MRHKKTGGKWTDNSVPKKGWSCIGIEDLENEMMICEMCESKQIRYVHIMSHPSYPDHLSVGCICSGKMEGSPDLAAIRETNFKNKIKRRQKWLTRKWRISSKGNVFINVKGYNIVIFRKNNGNYSGVITNKITNEKEQIGSYPTKEEAKLEIFELFNKVL